MFSKLFGTLSKQLSDAAVATRAPVAGSSFVVLSFSHAPGLQRRSDAVKSNELAYGLALA